MGKGLSRIEKACTAKHAYASIDHALTVIERMRARPPKGASQRELDMLCSYICFYCGATHIGKSDPSRMPPAWREAEYTTVGTGKKQG
jgi:hypothetical protein